MALYPRTFNPAGSWTGTKHQSVSQQNLPCLNTAERNRTSLSTPPSMQQYQYVRSTRFSASKCWRESGGSAVAQEQHSGVVKMPMSKTPEKMETLTFVSNFNHPQPTTVKSSQVAPTKAMAVAPARNEENLTYVGKITHTSNVTQDQLIALLNSQKASVNGRAVAHGVLSTQKAPLNPTSLCGSNSGVMKHAHPSTTIDLQRSTKGQELYSVTASRQRVTGDLTHMRKFSSSTRPMSSAEGEITFIPRPDGTTALLQQAGPLRFVGNFTLPAEALEDQHRLELKPAQVPCSVGQEGMNSLRVGPAWSTSSAPAGLPTGASSEIPTPSMSAAHYNPVELMEYHHAMASYYRGLKLRAEPVPNMEGPVCPKELPGNTGGIQGRAWDTRWEDDTESIILPADAVEKLDAIPGIWDLAIQMGFLTV